MPLSREGLTAAAASELLRQELAPESSLLPTNLGLYTPSHNPAFPYGSPQSLWNAAPIQPPPILYQVLKPLPNLLKTQLKLLLKASLCLGSRVAERSASVEENWQNLRWLSISEGLL